MELLHLYISPAHSFKGRHGKDLVEAPMEEVESVECIAGQGIMGDRYFGFKEDYKGQITFFADEVYHRICKELGIADKDHSVFRRNVITRGMDLNTLIGQEFEIQGVRFFGVEESKPCYWMNRAFGSGAEQALQGDGGLRARILVDGPLRKTVS